MFLIYSLLYLSLLTLKFRFSFSFSSLQNNNLARIPDQAFKNLNFLQVMYVRKWLPLVVVTVRYAFCTVTWEDHRLGLFYLIGRNALKFFRIKILHILSWYGSSLRYPHKQTLINYIDWRQRRTLKIRTWCALDQIRFPQCNTMPCTNLFNKNPA